MQRSKSVNRMPFWWIAFAVIAFIVVLVIALKLVQPPFTSQEAAQLRKDFAVASATNSQSADVFFTKVANRQKNGYLRNVMLQVRNRVDAGDSTAEALGKFPKVFPAHYVAVYRQAEHAKSRAEGIRIISQLAHE